MHISVRVSKIIFHLDLNHLYPEINIKYNKYNHLSEIWS